MPSWIVSHPLIDQPIGWYYALIVLYILAFTLAAIGIGWLLWPSRAVRAEVRRWLRRRRRPFRVTYTYRRDH